MSIVDERITKEVPSTKHLFSLYGSNLKYHYRSSYDWCFFFSKKIDKVVHVLQQMIYINNSSPIIYVKHYRYFSSRIIDDILVFMSSCIGYWYWLSISLLSRLGKRKKIKICFIKQNPKILNSFCLADKSTY